MTKADRKAQAEDEAEKFWEKLHLLSKIRMPVKLLTNLLVWQDRLLQLIPLLTESNRYHNQHLQNDNWKPISKEEIMAFIGVTIAMDIVKLPEIEQYWRKDGICNIPWFNTVMSYKRYKAILKFIHLVDNENLPDKDSPDYKLHKLGGIQDLRSQVE